MDLRQYRPAVVVQAAQIEGSDAEKGTVRISDVYGSQYDVAVGQMLPGAIPSDAWLLIFPDGKSGVVSDAVFQEEWNPVGGPVLL